MSDDPAGRHLGDLARGDARWQVYLETRHRAGPEARQQQMVEGRIHFVGIHSRRSTGWIFLEWSDAEVLARFNEFSPTELWKLVEGVV